MSSEFQKNIQNWVTLDNQIKTLNQQVKELRANRNSLTGTIFNYAESNNLENAVVQISDGKLKFQSEITDKLYRILTNENKYNVCNLDLSIKCYDKILNSLIDPMTFLDFVEYSSVSHSDSEYLKNSGTFGDMLNVSEVTPDILYSPLYLLLTNLISE